MNIEMIDEDFSFASEDWRREDDAEHRCVNKRGTGDELPLAFALPHSRPYDSRPSIRSVFQ